MDVLCRLALERQHIKCQGRTPEATMASALYTDVKRKGNKSVFTRCLPLSAICKLHASSGSAGSYCKMQYPVYMYCADVGYCMMSHGGGRTYPQGNPENREGPYATTIGVALCGQHMTLSEVKTRCGQHCL